MARNINSRDDYGDPLIAADDTSIPSGRFEFRHAGSAPSSLQGIPLNTVDIPRHQLDIASQTRANPLPWKGQFSPQLVEAFLSRYATPTSHVFDPFLGSGTVLAECIRQRLPASGSEVNPAAAILSRLYTLSALPAADRHFACEGAFRVIETYLSHGSSDVSTDTLGDVRPQDIANVARQQQDDSARLILEAALVLADPTWSLVRVERLLGALRRIRQLIASFPPHRSSVAVFDADARRVPLPDASVDLVVTSPPYINVFNYHQQYRPAIEALDIDVLEAARSEIGSNRKHRMNRFLTVVQYCLDMAAVLTELKRLLQPNGRMIFVLGRESRVRGVAILNGDLLSTIALQCTGIAIPMRQERAFTNRFGERIVEDILHLTLDRTFNGPIMPPNVVAQAHLRHLERCAEGEVRDDIVAAIAAAGEVTPSPLYVRRGV